VAEEQDKEKKHTWKQQMITPHWKLFLTVRHEEVTTVIIDDIWKDQIKVEAGQYQNLVNPEQVKFFL